MVALITPDELRNFLDVDYGELDDERAGEIIDGTSGVVLAHCNREGFEVTSRELLLDGTGVRTMLLPCCPIVSVSALVEDPRGAELELVDDVNFEWSEKGIVTRIDGGVWRKRARFYSWTIEEGYAAVPDAVKLVVKRLSARAVTNPEGLATESAGGWVGGYAFDDTRLPTVSAADARDLAPFVVVGG